MSRHRIDQLDVIALLGEPAGVDAGTTADVEDRRGEWWQIPLQQLQRPYPFQVGLVAQALVFRLQFIMSLDRRIDHRCDRSVAHASDAMCQPLRAFSADDCGTLRRAEVMI